LPLHLEVASIYTVICESVSIGGLRRRVPREKLCSTMRISPSTQLLVYANI
jgi:hypothetical protein